MNLGEQIDQIIEGLDGSTKKADIAAQARTLKADLDVSGAASVEVVRDIEGQPPVVSNMTPDGAVG